MAAVDVLQRERDLYASLFDLPKGEHVKSSGKLVERKLEYLEGLNGKVSNRRARRWLNDRILVELIPRMNEEEVRGLFAPPPFGTHMLNDNMFFDPGGSVDAMDD